MKERFVRTFVLALTYMSAAVAALIRAGGVAHEHTFLVYG